MLFEGDGMKFDPELGEELLWWMCERQRIWERRFERGEDPPWTTDPILQEYHLCNVYRELDYGTQIALEQVLREDAPDRAVLFNIVLYRLFNRPETYTAMGGWHDPAAFDPEIVVTRLDHDREPLFGSAYRVTTHDWAGADTKHENIIHGIVEQDLRPNLDVYTDAVFGAATMEGAFEALSEIDGVGDFLAYELVTDLNYRHLPFSENDFVNVGPGAASALIRLFGDSDNLFIRCLQDNSDVLFDLDFPYWEEKPELTLRDWEHSLCEWRKYIGVKYDDQIRRKFDPRDHAQDTLNDF